MISELSARNYCIPDSKESGIFINQYNLKVFVTNVHFGMKK